MANSRDRLIIGGGLVAIAAVSWVYLFWMARSMYAADCPMHNVSASWTLDYFWMTFSMWAIMMVAMMMPSAIPMTLTFALIHGTRAPTPALWPAAIFIAGYLVVWTAFSLAATLLQWGLHAAALLAPATLTVSPWLGGALLAAAGIYQWTPWKDACLAKCTNPLHFLSTRWRDGRWGAFLLGIRHGGFCTGCCAFLMILLFVAGVMNLLWIALLGGLVLAEKLAPPRWQPGRVFGVLFVVAAMALTAEGLWKG